MMRYIFPMRLATVLAILAILAILAATPLHAWEFSVSPICTLTHATEETTVRVTYDPRIPEYAIAFTRTTTAWPDAPVFALRFDGPRGNTISTTRHRLSEGGTTLTITDTGFGNVLDGLELNDTATALIGTAQVTIPLSGAATAVPPFAPAPMPVLPSAVVCSGIQETFNDGF